MRAEEGLVGDKLQVKSLTLWREVKDEHTARGHNMKSSVYMHDQWRVKT